MNAKDIEARLRAALAPTHIEVQDDGHLHVGHAGAREGGHFTVHITSARFAGLTRVARHRLVYDALGPLGPQRVHALAIVARAPGEAPAAA
jgi:BolA protein